MTAAGFHGGGKDPENKRRARVPVCSQPSCSSGGFLDALPPPHARAERQPRSRLPPAGTAPGAVLPARPAERGGGRGVPAAGCRPGPARPGARRQPRGAVGGWGVLQLRQDAGLGLRSTSKNTVSPMFPLSSSGDFFFFFFYILFCRGAGEPCGSKSAVAVSTSCTRVRLAHSAPLLTYWGEGKNTQRN